MPTGPGAKLFELGLKSLDLVELRHRLEAPFGIELPVTLFFSYATVGKLADYLMSQVSPPDAESGRGDTRAETATERGPALSEDDLEEMSEEEAARQLLERIADAERGSK